MFFFKQKTAYDMRISDWSSDVCSSDLAEPVLAIVDLAHFGFFDDAQDPVLRGLDLVEVGRGNLDQSFIVDVDLGTGFGHDFADHLAAGADHVADLRLVDLQGDDARGMRRKLAAGRDRKSTRLNSRHYCAYRMPST